MSFTIRAAAPEEKREVAHLIYDSTNAWYQKNRGMSVFSGEKDDALLFCRTYEALDGAENLLVAYDSEKGRIAGSCFVHPRPTHVSLGIMNVHPDYFGQGIAPMLLRKIADFARERGQTLYLVSSAMNLDSFSLYSRLGFTPYAVCQDMMFQSFDWERALGALSDSARALLPKVREAEEKDLPGIAALEREVTGLDHGRDFAYFIQNPDGIWKTWVLEGTDGKIEAVLASVCDPASCMLGPGFMRTDEQMAALICSAYRYLTYSLPKPAAPIFLVPCKCTEGLRMLYAAGARNTEIHLMQALGEYETPRGIVMPTFMPE